MDPPSPILTLFAELSFPATFTVAVALDTASVSSAAGNLALADRDVALGSLPTLLAVAQAASVVTVTRAEDGADT